MGRLLPDQVVYEAARVLARAQDLEELQRQWDGFAGARHRLQQPEVKRVHGGTVSSLPSEE